MVSDWVGVAALTQLLSRPARLWPAVHQRTDEGFRRPALPPSLTHPGRWEVRLGFTDAASPLSIAWSIDLGAANRRDGQQASNNEAVPSATDDPLSAGRLEKYTVPDLMLLLALTFGKCQNQMPQTALARSAMPTHRLPRQAH
jgi:hypothetical protein